MKRLRLLLVGAVAAVALVTANVATANNGATTIEFTTPVYTYISVPGFGVNGLFNCTGTRIIKTGPKAFVKDSETCHVTGGPFAPGTYPILPTWFASDYEWWLNYPGPPIFRAPIDGNITIVDNGDGSTTWHITAYYTP